MELEKQRYLDELAKLVNIDSVSSEPEGAGKIAAFMKEKYESIGWSVEEVSLSESIAPCLKIVNKEVEHYDVLLLAHMDTVFPLGTAAKRPFRIEGNRAYGPGVIDCKAGMLSGYYALANLQARGALQEAAICVFLNSDHEGISSRYSAGYSAELAGKSRYVLVLESGRANGNLVHKRKGIARYHIDIKGRAAHAGVDYQMGRNAVEELAHWVIALQAATDFTKETTVNVGKVWGGTGISAVPGAAGAAVDVRYYDKTEIERVAGVMDELQRHPHVEGTSAV
ncbi:MAG: M20/M25/M40 family metallo-hydrolase, partial [Selenomonas sp.]|nr:M20/M25/M40 family metallo-hydrolase [Selenomonas sp.]